MASVSARAGRPTYVVAAAHPWNAAAFERYSQRLDADWRLVTARDELTGAALAQIEPRFVFVPHWSWKIPEEVYGRYECVGFHAADLPFGRGGSPIQNLIARGHAETVVSAFRIGPELDAGDIYLKRPLSLLGSAEEIFLRAAALIGDMIVEIAGARPEPIPQTGDASVFPRRRPEQSELLPEMASLDAVFDHIRMLDAPGYPHAFLRVGPFVLRFRRAARRLDRVEADVAITYEPQDG